MILTSAPLRISFFGGGTDIESHYSKHGGIVLSAAIDKYMYISLNHTPINHVKLMYSEIEQVQDYRELKHDIVRNAIEHYSDKYKTGLEIASFADIPTIGTGLGSSSTFAVTLLKALDALNAQYFTARPELLAEWACDLEINKCGSPIGKQDQYASALGGMNLIRFNKDGYVDYRPQSTISGEAHTLKNRLLLFYTGKTRSANSILKKQSAEPKHDILNQMADQAIIAARYLTSYRLDDFGCLLDEAWKLKKQLTDGISDEHLDEIYEEAKKAGALGGKILGAGGGGYFLFYVPEDRKTSVIEVMTKMNLQGFDFNFSNSGASLLYNDSRI